MMRTETITYKVHQFDELDEQAKETARQWYREGALDYEWWDGVYMDAERIGLKITEFDLGRAQYCKGVLLGSIGETVRLIISEHGKDTDTYKLAQTYYRRKHDRYPMDEQEFTYRLLEEYRVMLDREYEWLMSDECVDESIVANEYEFLANGERYA